MNNLYVFWLMLMFLTGFSLNIAACDNEEDVDGDTDQEVETDGDMEEESELEDDAEKSHEDGDSQVDGDDEDISVDGDNENDVLPDGDDIQPDGDEENELDGDSETQIDGDVTEIESDSESEVTLKTSFSDCGGFVEETKTEEPNPYCGTDALDWQYDLSTETLTLTNLDVWLNCCGIHSMNISEMEGGGFLVAEIDEPESGGARCNCMCLFDYRVELTGVASQVLPIKITRLVTDMSSQQTQDIWQGSIDLSELSGTVTIEENVGWCD